MRTEQRRRTAPQLFTVVELQELRFSHGYSDYLSQSGLSDSPQEECTMLLCVCPTADRTRCALCEVRDVQYESRSCVQHVQYLAS